MTTLHHPLSVLQLANNITVDLQPFPHIIIHNALPDDVAKTLTQQFPVDLFAPQKQKLTDANNKRLDISINQAHDMPNMPAIWRDFLEYHSSPQFMAEMLAVFGTPIMQMFAAHYPNAESLAKLRAGIREIDTFDAHDLLLSTAISINTPVTAPNAVRAVHTDHGDKLMSGLFYLRRPQDNATGGNLQLFKWKDGYSPLLKRFFYQEGVPLKHVELVKEITYDNNVFVLFVNSLDALHAVTPRDITEYDRTFVNFVVEAPHKLFKKELPIVKKIRKTLYKKQQTSHAY